MGAPAKATAQTFGGNQRPPQLQPLQPQASLVASAQRSVRSDAKVDHDDGELELVQRRWKPPSTQASGAAGDTGGAASPAKGDADGPGEGAAGVGDRQQADVQMPGAENCEGGVDERCDAEEAEHQSQPHQELWKELQGAREELRFLKKKWGDEHWTVRMAKEHMEALDATWRQERPEGMLSRRHVRAEQAVRKADAKVAQAIEEIHELDRQYEAKREDLEARLEDERAKLRECRTKLDLVRAEVGAKGGRSAMADTATDDREGAADREALLATVQCLQSEIGPTLAAVSDGLETEGAADELKQKFQSVVAKLHSVHGVLQQRAEATQTR